MFNPIVLEDLLKAETKGLKNQNQAIKRVLKNFFKTADVEDFDDILQFLSENENWFSVLPEAIPTSRPDLLEQFCVLLSENFSSFNQDFPSAVIKLCELPATVESKVSVLKTMLKTSNVQFCAFLLNSTEVPLEVIEFMVENVAVPVLMETTQHDLPDGQLLVQLFLESVATQNLNAAPKTLFTALQPILLNLETTPTSVVADFFDNIKNPDQDTLRLLYAQRINDTSFFSGDSTFFLKQQTKLTDQQFKDVYKQLVSQISENPDDLLDEHTSFVYYIHDVSSTLNAYICNPFFPLEYVFKLKTVIDAAETLPEWFITGFTYAEDQRREAEHKKRISSMVPGEERDRYIQISSAATAWPADVAQVLANI